MLQMCAKDFLDAAVKADGDFAKMRDDCQGCAYTTA